MTVPVLDTHAWVGWMIGSSDITTAERQALDGFPTSARPYLSAISLWEVAMLVDLARLSLELPLADWLSAAAHPRTVRLVPITPAIVAGTATFCRRRFIGIRPIGSSWRRAETWTHRS